MAQIHTGQLKDVMHQARASYFAAGEDIPVTIDSPLDIVLGKAQYLKGLSVILNEFTFKNIDDLKVTLNSNVADGTVEMRKNFFTYDFAFGFKPSPTLYNEIIGACAKTFAKSAYGTGKFQVIMPRKIEVNGTDYIYKEVLTKTPDNGCARTLELPEIFDEVIINNEDVAVPLEKANLDEIQLDVAEKMLDAAHSHGFYTKRVGTGELRFPKKNDITYHNESELKDILMKDAGEIIINHIVTDSIFRGATPIQSGTLSVTPQKVAGTYKIENPDKRIDNFFGCVGNLPIIDGNEKVEYFNKGILDRIVNVGEMLHLLPKHETAKA